MGGRPDPAARLPGPVRHSRGGISRVVRGRRCGQWPGPGRGGAPPDRQAHRLGRPARCRGPGRRTTRRADANCRPRLRAAIGRHRLLSRGPALRPRHVGARGPVRDRRPPRRDRCHRRGRDLGLVGEQARGSPPKRHEDARRRAARARARPDRSADPEGGPSQVRVVRRVRVRGLRGPRGRTRGQRARGGQRVSGGIPGT